ncbi:hypothetical protein ASPACDRAFT_1858361 [Aspergillus aculeatus ATCC 16872]|uniref:Amidohydrolase-related domain-containing protein n=1 Tax=Aspergillus aculeatus (strain ATCC 16872 / CBS 172.66 / WB 5094) TaxID=690307 RepID=A0A1L9WN48_ASPA1|nr:uncharacterized protein ASPACDRAFT_1858361 [Aspergillus aculeatus ATCC 16872]OJJ97602.1 hypothetical protein ASPACDRAFT_1858361 [Aspergillus aculeatus ATCC 16872]
MGQPAELGRSPPPPTSRRRGVYLIPAVIIFLWTQFALFPRLLSSDHPATQKLSQHRLEQLEHSLQACSALHRPPIEYEQPTGLNRGNPRWSAKTGQSQAIVLRNATLFDGDHTLDHPVDITFHRGIITDIIPTAQHDSIPEDHDALVLDLEGRFVTPGLVDMHSHHIAGSSPDVRAVEDVNEIHPEFGPLTPYVRALDALKAYDPVAAIVASGGVTSSLILPGSANIMGGEAVPVKNVRRDEAGEELVEELLLEHGVPKEERRRYMKMACGENPKDVYGHTRMGNAFLFRKQMDSARQLLVKQDDWCLAAAAAYETGDERAIADLVKDGGLPTDIALESSVAMLRGQVGINIHCYESEDIEAMLRHSEEFGFRIQAFHHALEAWRVPDTIKNSGQNITVATFSHFAHYKHEAYDATLYAGRILTEHGVPVAYKSDGSNEFLNAKYLLSQAAEAHSFGLPEAQALQSVTSIPARSLELAHRIGYARPGYDADLVVWDSHPLANGATPLQVYIDGRATLNTTIDQAKFIETTLSAPSSRPQPIITERTSVCDQASRAGANLIITGITKTLIPGLHPQSNADNLTLVLSAGRIACFGPASECLGSAAADSTAIHLQNGHILPGLTAVTAGLGLQDIIMEPSTGDGIVSGSTPKTIIYAKHGLHPGGSKDLQRAKLGGITTAITAPLVTADVPVFLRGVSVAFKVSPSSTNNTPADETSTSDESQTLLDRAVLQPDVGLHIQIGQTGKTESTPTISSQIGLLRRLLAGSHHPTTSSPPEQYPQQDMEVYTQVANGTLPLIIHVLNHHDILHLVQLKRDFPATDLILFGATEAPLVARELAAARIPVLFTGLRPNPDTWEVKEALVGDPLTEAGLKVLVEAGVKVGLAQAGWSDSGIHNLGVDAGFAAKVAGLSEQRAVDLVSREVREILHLDGGSSAGVEGGGDGGYGGDFVVYEGNPLEWGASVVLTVDGVRSAVVECWPEAS